MARLPALAALPAAFLFGCTTLPDPTTALPEGNSQVRLTEAVGAVEGGAGQVVNGGVEGKSCILTTMGALPAGTGTFQQGGCVFSFVGDTTDELDDTGGP